MNNIVELNEVKAQRETETAEHIARESSELSELAARADMPFLKHLLDMTMEEAAQQSYVAWRRRTDTR